MLSLFCSYSSPLLSRCTPSLLSPSPSTETIKLMRPEVGAAAVVCFLSFLPRPSRLSLHLLHPLTYSFSPVYAISFPSLSFCLFATAAKLCLSGDSGDRHFISAFLTSWCWVCVNMCVCVCTYGSDEGSWLMGGGEAGFIVVLLLLLHTLRQR